MGDNYKSSLIDRSKTFLITVIKNNNKFLTFI